MQSTNTYTFGTKIKVPESHPEIIKLHKNPLKSKIFLNKDPKTLSRLGKSVHNFYITEADLARRNRNKLLNQAINSAYKG